MTLSEQFEVLSTRIGASEQSGPVKIIQWNLTGKESGSWAFEIGEGTSRMIPGGVDQPDTTITTSGETWTAIAEGTQDPMKAFMMGQVSVTGNMTLALRVTQIFQATGPIK